jgi:hypothetical protein
LAFAPALLEGRVGERLANELGSNLHATWFWRCLVRTAELELQRLDAVNPIAADWYRLLGKRYRLSRAPNVLPIPLRQLATKVRGLLGELGTAFRGAQLFITDFDRTGTLRKITGLALDRA